MLQAECCYKKVVRMSKLLQNRYTFAGGSIFIKYLHHVELFSVVEFSPFLKCCCCCVEYVLSIWLKEIFFLFKDNFQKETLFSQF